MPHATTNARPHRVLQLAAWAAALWIAYEFLWYEQYKLAGPTLVFDILSQWSGIPETPFRLFVAAMEIIAAILVLVPRTQAFGALFALGIMTGAIGFHLFTPLGIDPYGDGGVLFKEACFTWAMAALVVVIRRAELLALGRWAIGLLARRAPGTAPAA
ncbi:MAG: DoxX family protein [Acetobacteraceae bacterium]|nr:DoxX family protein [Acetobacteraceae bacterium]